MALVPCTWNLEPIQEMQMVVRLILILALAMGSAVAADGESGDRLVSQSPSAAPSALEGAELAEMMRLRAEAAEARVAHLAAVNQAQEKIREADRLSRAADDAAARMEAWARERAGESGCVLQPDGSWECEEGSRDQGPGTRLVP